MSQEPKAMEAHGQKGASEAGDEASAAWREQIGRILAGEVFRGRDSLKRLLTYLADRTIGGVADGLKEYAIGVDVFHKPPDYEPQRDGSVRQQIGKLRLKLEEYYRTEGNRDPIQVELPKGRFRLVFEHRAVGSTTEPRTALSRWLPAFCVALLLPVACWIGWHVRGTSSPGLDPAVRLLWAPFLDSARPTVVCLGTPLFLRNQRFRVRDSRWNAIDAPETQAAMKDLSKKLGLDGFVPSFDYTGTGEAAAAIAIARIFAEGHREVAVSWGNVLSWNDIKNQNVIFVGPPKFNPHLHAIPVNLDFTIGPRGIVNAHPRAGESANYPRILNADENAAEDYVLINRLPGIDPSGTLLILEGSSTSSAWAAADYITRPAMAKELVSRIKSPDGRVPPFFQVLLHVKYKDSVPTHTAFVTSRAVNPRGPAMPAP